MRILKSLGFEETTSTTTSTTASVPKASVPRASVPVASVSGASVPKASVLIAIVQQSGIKCVIVASAMRAEQGPCEPIKGCIREIREQY